MSKIANSSSTPRKFSPWPFFSEDEIAVVHDVLKSGKVNYWTGEQGVLFEKEYADSLNVKHAIAMANGTVALEAIFHALDIGEGDDVIVTSRTFLASATSAMFMGARPIFADVDLDSQNVTAASIEKVLTPNTKAIVLVHLAGWPCDMDPILSLAEKHNLKVIEDCAQAHGAKYKGRPVGSMGHVNAFSFCQDKILTTGGEGGLVTTNSSELWEKMWSYKDHGKNYNLTKTKDVRPGFKWVHDSLGTNLRLTEIQSAIGRVILKKLPDWVNKRRANANLLIQELKSMPIVRIPLPSDDIYHSYYKFYAFLNIERCKEGWNRDRILAEIFERGVPCFPGSSPEIYLEKVFDKVRPTGRLENAKKLGETSMMFLVHPTLGEDEMAYMAKVLKEVLTLATR